MSPQRELAETWREIAETVVCPVVRCHAEVGERCRNANGTPMAGPLDHLERMELAGVVFEPTTEFERQGLPVMRTEESERAMWAKGREAVEAHRKQLARRAEQGDDHVDPYADDNVLWLRGPQRHES